jgi:cell division protein FtsN
VILQGKETGLGMLKQRGGVFLGLVIGLVIGLGIALSVAIYVTNVPVPFVNKGQSRTAEQDEAEARKNKNWDPNAPLYGKNPAKAVPATNVPDPATAPSSPAPAEPSVAAPAPTVNPVTTPPAVSSDPLGDLARTKAAEGAFTYFIQIGAFDKPEAAEARRAELALAGIDAKVSERVQSGKTIYRVRFGPFASTEESQRAQERLEQAGVSETALVRIKN